MPLFCTTRHGVSARELQCQLGVTYKTAYRIGQIIPGLTAKAQGFKLPTMGGTYAIGFGLAYEVLQSPFVQCFLCGKV